MQVEVDVKCMQTNFGGRVLSGFGDFAPFQILTNFPFEPWAIIHGGSKNTCTCMLSSISYIFPTLPSFPLLFFISSPQI